MPSTKAGIIAAIGRTEKKTASARDRKKSKNNPTGFAAVWNDSIQEYWEGEPEALISPTMKSLAMLKRAMNRIHNTSAPHRRDFIKFTVEAWNYLGRNNPSLSKDKKYPPYPNLNYFISRVDMFYSAYCRKDSTQVSYADLQKTVEKLQQELGTSVKQLDEQRQSSERVLEENRKLKAEIKRLKARRRRGTSIEAWD